MRDGPLRQPGYLSPHPGLGLLVESITAVVPYRAMLAITRSPHPWWPWLTADRALAIAGLVLTIAGFAFALWQLWRTKTAVERAKAASLATKELLRDGDLQRLIDVSLACQRRLIEAGRQATAVRFILSDWLEAYARIVALIAVSKAIKPGNLEAAGSALEDAKLHVLLVRENTYRQDDFRSVDMPKLNTALASYAEVINKVSLDLVDEEVASRA